MLAAGIDLNARNGFLVVAVNKSDPMIDVEFDQHQDVIRICLRSSSRLPRLTSVVLILIFLNPHGSVGEQIHAVGMIPVDMADYDVGYVFGFETGFCYGLRRFDKVPGLPLL